MASSGEAPYPITVHAAVPGDCGAINDIYNFYVRTSVCTFDTTETSLEWRERWLTERLDAGFPVLVAVRGGDVLGWSCLSRWSPKGAYRTTADESIYLRDDARGLGIGRLLLGELLGRAPAIGIEVVMAGVVRCQEQSLGLHRAMGFVESGCNRHMGYKLGGWHDVVYLQRHLWE
ncbi:hypothetical protein AYO38_04285 [bacterium SCGC AG-212-C10]|nr:hypothetical protein AYO38_04285 [bacterium SCGC AG-212-C10]